MRLTALGSRIPKWDRCSVDTAAAQRRHPALGHYCMERLARPLQVIHNSCKRSCKCSALGDNTVTWTQDDNIELALGERFKAADLDGNGLIDREEFGHLAETTGAGTECTVFHWLADSTIDEIFDKYAEDEAITYEAFKRLAADGVLLEGRMAEYRALFERAPTFRPGAPSMVGTIEMEDLSDLAGRLETPLTAQDTASLIDQFCCKRECGVAGNERITFEEFLNMFRDHMLDLQQITEYLKLEAAPIPESSPEELEDAAKLIPEDARGVYNITSSEELDAFLKLYPEKVVVLLCGLSWCRPCKSLTRPLEKLAAHYEGSVFLKVMGDTNNNTKRLFKNHLKVKATPHISYFHKGIQAYFRTGANKAKLEAGLRRFYNTEKYPLPQKTLYPLAKPAAA